MYSGVEYYFGNKFPNSDLTLQDFRSRDLMWDQNRHALEFFSQNEIPFWNMTNANSRLSGDNWCLAHTNGDVLVVYLREGGSDSIDLSDTNSSYLVQWFDPRNGGGLQLGSIPFVLPKQFQSLGEAPDNPWDDWVVLLRHCTDCTSDGESKTGLIAGWAVAGLFVVATVLLVVERQFRRRESVENSRKSSSFTSSAFPSGDISRGQDPPTASNDSTNRTESGESEGPVIIGEVMSPREIEGPRYKDQVVPHTNLESDFVPDVAIMMELGGSPADETENTPKVFRVEL